MIFVTVGTQLPFDRLIEAIDCLTPKFCLDVIAQTRSGRYVPRNIATRTECDPITFEHLLRSAEIVVSHAGIGTILTAQHARKPIIIMPRRAALGEHRNDHQLATASQLEGRPGIYVAYNDKDLECLLSRELQPPPDRVSASGANRLKAYLSEYLLKGNPNSTTRFAR